MSKHPYKSNYFTLSLIDTNRAMNDEDQEERGPVLESEGKMLATALVLHDATRVASAVHSADSLRRSFVYGNMSEYNSWAFRDNGPKRASQSL